jgi:osmotically-inducible protein OsmY
MKRALCGLALAFAVTAFAQQQSPTNPPPYTTPPTFPDDQASRQEMPPDTKAPAPQGLSTAEVEQQIQDKLNREPILANTNVGVKTDDKSVTLTGTVDTDAQHDLALRIAQSYAGDRTIVDKITVRGQA